MWTIGVVIGLQLAIYFGIYLLTPLELTYHLNTSLDRLYQANLDYFHTLEDYIAAGVEKLRQLDEIVIPEQAKRAEASGEVIAAQALRDLRAARDDLERRVHDLRLTRQVSMQSLPGIRLVQENDKGLVNKINVQPAGSPRQPHDHVRWLLSGGLQLTFNDPRRFGFMDLAETARLEESKHFSGMGPEPMSDAFTPASLFNALRRRSAPLKAALLDQSVVAGLGNIYVCEALYCAGLSPRRKASTLSAPRAERLHAAIRRILADAIDAGGSTLRDFAASDGSLGYFQHRFKVYDREGDMCASCGVPVRRIVQSGRSTFYCRKCQK